MAGGKKGGHGSRATSSKATSSKDTSSKATSSKATSSKAGSKGGGSRSASVHSSSVKSSSRRSTIADDRSSSHGSELLKVPSPPRYDGNRDNDPAAWQEFAGGAPLPSPLSLTLAIRNLDLGGAAWAKIRGFAPDTPLPPKPPISTAGKEVRLTLNTFPVLTFPERTVWQYDVLIGNGAEPRGKTSRAWHSPTVQKKLGKNWLFDGNRLAWSLVDLQKELREVIDLDKEYGQQTKRKIPMETTVVVRKSKQLNFNTLSAYLKGKCDFDQHILEAITFLDHLLREWPSTKYNKIKRNFFSRPQNRFMIGEGVEAFHGVYASMRPVHSIDQGAQLSVNVDVANGTFWTEAPVHYTAREVARCRDLDDLVIKLQPETDRHGARVESQAFRILRMFRKLRVSVTYRNQQGEPVKYQIDKFLNQSAEEYEINVKDPQTGQEQKISLFDYFKKAYNLPLAFRKAPIIQTTKPNVVLPMELCRFLPNQRYLFKLNDQQTSNMIKFAVTPPDQRWKNVVFGLNMLNWSEDPNLKAYGLKMDSKPATIKAHVLPNPKVQFGNTVHNPGTSGRWDLRGKKFMAGNQKELKSWGIMVVDGRGAPDRAAVQRFITEFVKIYTGHGGKVVNPKPVIMPSGAHTDGGKMVEALWTATGNANQMRPQILMFVLLFKEIKFYNRIKKSCDCRYGVVSQCMQAAHVLKCQAQYISNVCMKFNAKLGGFTSRAVGIKNNPEWSSFSKPTLIMGGDVSHAAPGSVDIPSMACMTFSTNKPCTRYAAAIQTNGHRVELISSGNIQAFMSPMITEWCSNLGNGRVPEQLIYFRDGISEGQYLQLLDQEVSDIKAVLKSFDQRETTKLTVIVATKRHHIRFFPDKGDRNAADKNGNPLPGMLVQTGCTAPFEYDFYLCSHSAIKGTARPVNYHVLLDENKFPPSELFQMIYDHSYQYIRSTTPVSIHPAIYYAHIAAKRAAAHENKPSESGPTMKKKSHSHSDETKKKDDDEFLPLIPMPETSKIKFEMWYC
ncbi:MAG: hypothetical protein M1822_004540 [Bathelium mastoideum]|nr:MAG: hypothetical protein M1822_004540 [Bathelium mastoideum]